MSYGISIWNSFRREAGLSPLKYEFSTSINQPLLIYKSAPPLPPSLIHALREGTMSVFVMSNDGPGYTRGSIHPMLEERYADGPLSSKMLFAK